MALPPMLARGKNLDLLRKSEKELFEIIESAVALADWRWPEELHRRPKPFFNKQLDPDDGDGYITSAVPNRETECIDPAKRRKVIHIQLQPRDQNSSNSIKPAGTSVVGKARVAMAAPKRKFEELEYEKKLEDCKRKLREGYNQYTDSRKRSKVIDYIPI